MHRNVKLKHAVATALGIIALGAQQSSFALGLGDINVHSSLGQPLKAKIAVLGAEELQGKACLRLGANSDLRNVNFMMGPISNNAATLTLTSNQLINEPIVNLSVIAGCDASLRRDYVLLLDPPLTNFSSNNNIDPAEEAVIVQKIDTPVETSTAVIVKPTVTTTEQAIKKAKKKTTSVKKAAVKSSKPKTKKATNTTTGNTKKQSHLITAKEMKPVAESQPRLMISGSSDYSAHNNLNLRMDKQLTFVPDPKTAMVNPEVVIEDEITSMNNRLSHLQTQIAALQAQNQKLASENKIKTAELMQAKAQNETGILWPVIGAGLLVIGGFASFVWLRRREQEKDAENTVAWYEAPTEQPETSSVEEEIKPLSRDEDHLFDHVDFEIEDSAEDNQLVPVQAETENETEAMFNEVPAFLETQDANDQILVEEDDRFSVLDHADVFLSHGRASLAIQLLQNHLIEHPKQSVTIWLFLLDLLAKENMESLYEQTALDCKLHFNVQIADFSTPETNSSESLEDFPRLAKGLEDVWGTPAAVVYLDDLIYNNRLEPRAGLPKNLIEELVLLRTMAQESVNSAEVIQLDEKKLALIEQKEALLETRKAEKLQAIAEAERAAREAKEKAEAEEKETSFEFTLIERT